MALLPRLLITIAFAAHVLLGCCAHQPCPDGLTIVESAANSGHDCAGDHRHEPHERTGGREQPVESCQHPTCSFVKVESAGADQDDAPAAWLGLAAPHLDAGVLPASLSAEAKRNESLCATQLYLWHCALLL